MKRFAIFLFAFFFAFSSVFAKKYKSDRKASTSNNSYTYIVNDHRIVEFDDINIDIDDGSIIMTEEGTEENKVEITEEYELFVNDQEVKLTPAQKEMTEDFHTMVMDIVYEGKKIGWEGAKIGIRGAKLGMKAIGRLMKMVFTSYDEDDFERDMERDADEIEAQASKLEDRAKIIERMADDLEYVTEDLFDNVPELRRLEWF